MKSLVSSALSLTMALGAVGCAGPRMVAPADVAQGSEVLEVTDRSSMSGSLVNESFKLGSFAVSDVDRDWNKKSSFSVVGYSNATTTTGYSYKVKGGAGAWEGSCASSANDKGVHVMGGSVDWGSTKLTCECKQGSTSASVVLNSGSPDNDKNSAGALTVGDAKYNVSPVNSLWVKLIWNGTFKRPTRNSRRFGTRNGSAMCLRRPFKKSGTRWTRFSFKCFTSMS